MASAHLLSPETAPPDRWLSIVGIGEDGVEGLNPLGRELVQSASVVFGGERHLELAASLIRGSTRLWAHPFEKSINEVLALRGQAICVLASGEPFCHGVGSALSRHVCPEELRTVPSSSAFSLAASWLAWPLSQTILLSLCGRPLDLIRPHLHPGSRLLVLSSDDKTPPELARLMESIGFGRSKMTLMERLGGPHERVRATLAKSFDLEEIDPLNIIAVEVVADAGARILPKAPGQDDALFEHDGQITKREIRALTLSALAPRHGERLWDIGAGSGSVSIEWLLADLSLSAIAIEGRSDRAARIRRNAAAFGVPRLQLVEGLAPAVLAGLAEPDAIFVGGGATAAGVLEAAIEALRPGVLLKSYAQHGGSLTRISISRATPVGGEHGRMTGWLPARPIMQWTWIKS
jgi:precorrin-6Y C5,15-methyltransferase (decarboxylating)